VGDRFGVETTDYQSLWQWSTDEPAAFWAALWDYFEFGDRPGTVLESESMPGTRWFPGARLNYVDRVIRSARPDRPAIVHVSEDGTTVELSWDELLGRTAAFADTLPSHGVSIGDRVAGYLPNIPEAVIALPGDGEYRRDLERMRAGLLGQGCAGPTGTARAGRPHDRRGL